MKNLKSQITDCILQIPTIFRAGENSNDIKEKRSYRFVEVAKCNT